MIGKPLDLYLFQIKPLRHVSIPFGSKYIYFVSAGAARPGNLKETALESAKGKIFYQAKSKFQ